MPSLKDRLTEILLKNNIITEDKLKTAINRQKEKGGRLSDILIELKFITESELVSSLSQGLGFPIIDLLSLEIDPEIINIIPYQTAQQYQIIPLSKREKFLTIAMADPLDVFAMDDIRALTGYKIIPLIATASDIANTIDKYYGSQEEGEINTVLDNISEDQIELVEKQKEETLDTGALLQLSQEAPVIKITNMILEDAIKMKASDVLIEIGRASCRERV